jgi:hypothetical protein
VWGGDWNHPVTGSEWGTTAAERSRSRQPTGSGCRYPRQIFRAAVRRQHRSITSLCRLRGTCDQSITSSKHRYRTTTCLWSTSRFPRHSLVRPSGVNTQYLADILGPEAGEWLQQAALAICAQIPLDVLADTIQPFPTFLEIYVAALKQLRAEIAAS